jgi:hypothetical protein
LGTNTYFRQVEAYEERVSVDSIMQRRHLRNQNQVYEWRVPDVKVESDVSKDIINFLKPSYKDLEKLES